MIDYFGKMNMLYESMRQNDSIQELYKYFKNKPYLALFLKQYKGLIINVKSICLLIEEGNIEDAFTIFRKYLETYFIIMSILEHPELVAQYIKHDFYLGQKVCKKNIEQVKEFCEGKPDGFLEYGYVERYVEIDDDFRYTMKTIAKVGNVIKFHKWYKMCNNFVHNNLTMVNIDRFDGKDTLCRALEETIDYMFTKIKMIFE